MTLSNARYDLLDGHPVLRLEVDGMAATLDSGAKAPIHAAGLVSLGWRFESETSPIMFDPGEGGSPLVLEGFTRDPRVWKLYDDFLRAAAGDSFAPGPVAIPA